ncbi:PREDICTED: NACHT, LRR and PYD domains-containing protein 12-like [Nanorana parkeri]|uniref:NACHT, LRR and PYD domains-containing protein 12-like n=1 Tax=Nanorana parkeri TaxID=125878 RepID=UPI000853F523|nr:PREDICTED: NACHT, LRR and PYD domains-containing protein 12-like [Nanorana parkeri]
MICVQSNLSASYKALLTVVIKMQGHRWLHSASEAMVKLARMMDWRVQYMTVMKQKFQCTKEHNSRIGEAVSLDRRYTRLLMVKRYRNQKEKEHELMALGLRHQQIMEERSSDECARASIQTMFNPNEEGVIPKIVVLQGPAGIGKTMTSKKIMLDWASGNLYHDEFSFVFYLSCRELNTITDKISLGRLLSRTSKFQFPEDVMQSILSNAKKLLFVIDGFDEVRWSLKDNFTVCGGPLQETHREVLLRSLVNKRILCEASLVITTRPFALEKLDELIEDVCSCHMEILGFTEEDFEEYFHNSFHNEDDADKALSIIKDNEVLHTMSAVPITCWIVCTVLKQEIKKDLDLILCRIATSVYLLYLKGLLKYHGRNQPTHNCLKKLCALANEGILKQQILFQEEDLERHGFSLSEVESVFLNENIFHQDIDSSTCYSFIHLSMQEFFAAMNYVMEEEEVTRDQVAFLPEICEGKSLSQLSSSSPHLALTLQFLFGLTNEKQLKELSKITRRNVSFQAARAIRDWLVGEDPSKYRTQSICCLYETQDEDFVRAVMCRSTDLEFRLMEGKFCARELAYCLKFSADISALTFVCNIMGQKDLEVLYPFMQRCSSLKIACYVKISSVPCNVLRDLIITSQKLKQLDLSEIHLRDSDVHLLCEGLRVPCCTLQELSLFCDLSHFTCHELRTVIMVAKPSLELQVIFHVSFTMAMPEAETLCQTLRLPNCTFLNDSILHDRMARLFLRTIHFAYKNSWCRPSSSTVSIGRWLQALFGCRSSPDVIWSWSSVGPSWIQYSSSWLHLNINVATSRI